MENQETTTCSNCNFTILSSEKFCKNCGHKISEKAHSHFMFLNTFFKIDEIYNYIKKYYRTIASPTKVTIQSFENETLSDSLKFLEFGAVIYILLVLSRLLVIKDHDFISGLLMTFSLVLTWSINFYIFYKLSVNAKKAKKRSYNNFLEFSGLYLGFTMPIIAVVQWVQLFINVILGSVLLLCVCVPIMIFSINAWTYFWGLSGTRIFWTMLFASLIAGLINVLFVYAVNLYLN